MRFDNAKLLFFFFLTNKIKVYGVILFKKLLGYSIAD